MSSCDLVVTIDPVEGPRYPGDDVSGTVKVLAHKDVEPRGLVIEQLWSTHGRGNHHEEVVAKQVEAVTRWQAGQSYEFPFHFTAPEKPVSYHGHYINVDHYVRARADLAWATDPKSVEDYLVAPGETSAEAYVTAATKKETPPVQQAGGCGKVIGWILLPVLLPLLIMLLVMILPFVLIAGLVMFLRVKLAERVVGKVEATILAPSIEGLKKGGIVSKLKLGGSGLKGGTHVVGPGSTVPVRLAFTPRRDVNLNVAKMVVTATEEAVSGSGTNSTTHRHMLWEETLTLVEQGVLPAGEPVDVTAQLQLPDTDAFSLEAPSNKIAWKAHVAIDIAGSPDWVCDFELLMVPAS